MCCEVLISRTSELGPHNPVTERAETQAIFSYEVENGHRGVCRQDLPLPRISPQGRNETQCSGGVG